MKLLHATDRLMPRRVGTRCPRCTRRRAKGERCTTCAQRAHKATTDERGYGAKHQLLRAIVAVEVAEGRAICWRCGHRISPDAKWDLGHDDNDRSIYRGPEHARQCNRKEAGRRQGQR